MDPSLLWLRRYVVARAIERAAIEAVAASASAGAVLVWMGTDALAAIGLVLLIGPITAVLRVVVGLSANPVSHRYLLSWADPSDHLDVVPGPGDDRPDGSRFEAAGFRFVLRMARSVDPAAHTDVAPDTDAEAGTHLDGVDLYRGAAGRVLAARGADGGVTLLSRLGDGRLMVTSTALVPPRAELLVNQVATDTFTELVDRHAERLVELGRTGLTPVAVWPESLIDLVRLEWDAWWQLGPAIGPMIAVEPSPVGRIRFEVRVPPPLLWERGRALDRQCVPNRRGWLAERRTR